MASDLSSGCTEANEVIAEKEEGEISLEDVSSSEEGHLNYGYGVKTSHCPNCLSTQHFWCTAPPKLYHPRSQSRRDAVQGKENRHHSKESGCAGTKHIHSTLQEIKNDLVPISSDSDIEIVGLPDSSKQIVLHSASTTRLKKKRKKKRTHAPVFSIDDMVSSSSVDMPIIECVSTLKHDSVNAKGTSLARQHHREVSPIHRSSRSRLASRSPPRRHRSPIRTRSPFKKSLSPILRTRSPITRRSPRRLKSPKRSSYRSPVKTTSRKSSQAELSSSHNYNPTHGSVNKLLKKVRQLDSVGTQSLEATLSKNKEHASSLKEKLTNMMKAVSDSNGNVTNYSKEKSVGIKKAVNDADDEEDLALLRQKALETKQKKLNKRNDEPKIDPTKKAATITEDDQDEEDLQLRMIALRSAILKKHKNRIQRGVKSGKSKKTPRSESPFSQSFLDSIPIPGEQLLSIASPQRTPPPPMIENNHTEDMELDTDVEREKEKLPYSPTDKITTDIPIDTELLGIQPSDVSFINLNEVNITPAFSTMSMKDEPKSLKSKSIENRSYLPSTAYYAGSQTAPCLTANPDVTYAPSNSIEILRPNFVGMEVHNPHVTVHHYSESCNIPNRIQNDSNRTEMNSVQELPYSPTDTPMYDPDLLQTLSRTIYSTATSNSSMISVASSYNSNVHENVKQYGHATLKRTENMNAPNEALQHTSNVQEVEPSDKADTFSMDPAVGSAPTSVIGSASPTSSMITIDDLPETDTDASPPNDTLKDTKSSEYIPQPSTSTAKETTSEPLYMQGLPDITKDANKIPTLINRTLVPAPILKSNKQLQQPLLTRKSEVLSEPTFKTANMQPVAVNEEISTRPNAIFKPMKLLPPVQKAHAVLTTPVAFHDSFNESTANETSLNDATQLKGENLNVNSVQTTVTETATNSEATCDTAVPASKKKKVTKRGGHRRNSTTQLSSKKTGPSDKNKTSSNKKDTQACTTVAKDVELPKEIFNDKNTLLQSNETRETCEESEEAASVDRSKNNTTSNLSSHESPVNTFAPGVATNAKILNDKDVLGGNTEIKTVEDVAKQKPDPTAPTEPGDQVNSFETRRQSLDEDEEALRAILLASLPKRTKATESSITNAAPSISTTVTNSNSQTTRTSVTPSSSNASPVLSQRSSSITSESGIRPNAETQVSVVTAKISTAGGSAEAIAPFAAGRKRPMPTMKGPQKKIMRKVLIPASTKVVNNAKKYQNSIVQRKLTLQKAATMCNNQKSVQSAALSKTQPSENKWGCSTKTSVADTQRIVISLGSDTESDSESEWQKKKNKSASSTPHPPMVIPTTEFEKNLEQFLRYVRKKQESVAAARPTSLPDKPKKDVTPTPQAEKTTSPSNLHTPLEILQAVRHLPAPQQEEYRRLKQQIIERERLRLRRTIETNTNNPNISQTASQKGQSVSVHQPNNENNLRNLNTSKSIPTTNLRKMQLCTDKSPSADKQTNAEPLQGKAEAKSMAHLSIRIANEKLISQNNAVNKVSGNSVTPLNTSRTVLEHGSTSQEVKTKPKARPTLKVLTRDEVNRKCVQIQVKHDACGRVVTINDKVTPNEKVLNDRGEYLSGKEDAVERNTCDRDINDLVQNVEKEIVACDAPSVNNEIVDSDASTVALPRENQDMDSRDGFDTTESTVQLSQYQEESRARTATKAKTRDNDNNAASKSDAPLDNKGTIEENWKAIRKDVKAELNSLSNLPRVDLEMHLKDTEQKLVMKRYTILDELAEMSGNLRQWHMERDLQTNLVAEVKKLREQLKVAERRLQLQRNRINSIGPKVVAAHGKINVGRRECFKLSKMCSVLGARIIGEEYKVPEAGAQLLDNRLKEVASHTRQLSKKKVPSIDIPEICSTNKDEEKINITDSEVLTSDDSVLERSSENGIKSDSDGNDSCNESIASGHSTELQSTAVELDETSCKTEVEESNEFAESAEQSTSEQDNNILNMNPELSSTPIVSKRCDKMRSEQPSESARPSTSVECNVSKQARPDSEQQTKKALVPYVSILTHLKVPRNTNPNGVLCPYELMGTCNDGDCQFVHQSESQTK